MTSAAQSSGQGSSTVRPGGLAGMTPSGRAIVPASWALYDFANTIFSFAVVSVAIGLYLVNDHQFGERDGNALLSLAVVVSVGINALVSPILGAFSDRGAGRMPFLLFFTALCIGATFFIADVPPTVGLALFIVANFAYQAALIYYDATLKTVSYPDTRGRLSGIGTAVGYLGTVFAGLVILLLAVPVADRFRVSAILFLVFAIPIFLFVRERRVPGVSVVSAADVRDSFGQLRRSIAHAREVPGLGRFLLGRFFYSDAVNTVIVVMSVVTVKVFGLSDADTVSVLLSLTLVAIAMSFVWGWLADRRGPKRTLVWVLASWAVGLIIGGIAMGFGPAGFPLFLVAGAILGSGLGGVQVADRVLMVRLSPPDRIGEFFGIYGLVGKGSQVVGQTLYGVILFLLLDSLGRGAYQVAVVTLLATMLIGLWLVWPVRDDWAGSGENVLPESMGPVAPPERLAPAGGPLEPR
ncbi:MAG TPA: MFS transporter [Candidatus Limnocylindrales bacterium]|nr:MFS transporter [Candidatus Limnocylindrales bacterium]